ncbi:tRNA pseudouridine(38-40) synthase TruA [Halocatena marina]|uniref:tRNA pseudouridine(38-40) synthase TruA n=1 Tax=Halocatena marina TaxID=2934937 RepID=UPI00200E076C|nr:tRNA pseudouridine(38-40) synthase TruA [Halocatena marina]
MRAFRLAYDGTPYHGFQRQPDVPTVEGELFAALTRLGVRSGTRPDGYAAAGRTDAGVSAVAQTVAFHCPEWLSPRALNSELPGAVRAWASTETSADFHATHDATEREYTYHLWAPKASLDRASAALDALAGTHDFHNLTPDDELTTRTLETNLSVDGSYLIITLRAGGFSRQLVRRVVGLVEAVAHAERDDIDRVLSSEELSGPDGVPNAPPEPLVLTGVEYPNLSFERDSTAVKNASRIFETKRIERETGARTAGTIAKIVRN